MIRGSGRTVTSVRNGFPSTLPTRSTDAWLETGKSGFVMVVGSEKTGPAGSPRADCGAIARPSGGTGCSIWAAGVALGATGAGPIEAVGLAGVGDGDGDCWLHAGAARVISMTRTSGR